MHDSQWFDFKYIKILNTQTINRNKILCLIMVVVVGQNYILFVYLDSIKLGLLNIAMNHFCISII
jgi:hypothetical protein